MKIELGEEIGIGAMTAPAMPEPPKKYYPTIHVSGKENHDFPSEGTMEVTFKKVREEVSTDEEGNTRYSCTLEIQSIDEIEGEDESGDMPKNHGREAEDALDALARKLKEKY